MVSERSCGRHSSAWCIPHPQPGHLQKAALPSCLRSPPQIKASFVSAVEAAALVMAIGEKTTESVLEVRCRQRSQSRFQPLLPLLSIFLPCTLIRTEWRTPMSV